MTRPGQIPKRIIQTAKSRDLSPLARAAATNLKLLHPDWEFLFFDDGDINGFVRDEFPEYLGIFNGFPHPIQRIDFFRYLAIYRLGGFYFDLDVFLFQALNDLLEGDCVFPFEELTLMRFFRETYRLDWEIGNYAFAAKPGHPFLKAVIENCVRAQEDHAWVRPALAGVPRLFRADFEVLCTTGPALVTRTMAEFPDIAEKINILFPENVCDSSSWHLFGGYGIHNMEGSWRTKGSFIRRRLALRWESAQRLKLMADSLKLGPKRTLLSLRPKRA